MGSQERWDRVKGRGREGREGREGKEGREGGRGRSGGGKEGRIGEGRGNPLFLDGKRWKSVTNILILAGYFAKFSK